MLSRDEINNNFLEYVSSYEVSTRVNLKKNHILRVANNCVEVAESLNLTEEQIELAYVIGICHDIGRFEQVRIHNTFSDSKSGMNHAAYSNKVLFEDGLIRKFINTDMYDEVIRKAVYNHNKNQIEDGLDEEELLFAKIIRDADKLDILYVTTIEDLEDLFWSPNFVGFKINKKFISYFYAHKFFNYKDITSNLEQIICFYNFIYDLNFKITTEKILENDYYGIFNERLKTVYHSEVLAEQLDNLRNHVMDYLKRWENV